MKINYNCGPRVVLRCLKPAEGLDKNSFMVSGGHLSGVARGTFRTDTRALKEGVRFGDIQRFRYKQRTIKVIVQ